METVKDRLMQFLESRGISKSEFSRRMGLSNAYIGSMRKSMPSDKVSRLMELFPELNREWLLYGEGSMLKNEETAPKNPTNHRDRRTVPLLPVEAYAGNLSAVSDGVMPYECEQIEAPVKGCDFAIRTVGNSMTPEIESGTILYLAKINDAAFIPYGNPMVIDTENGVYVKVVNPSEKGDDYLRAHSYNPAYSDFDIPKSSIYGIYRVVWLGMPPRWM